MERNFDIVSINIAEKHSLLSSRRFLGERQNENIGGWKRSDDGMQIEEGGTFRRLDYGR